MNHADDMNLYQRLTHNDARHEDCDCIADLEDAASVIDIYERALSAIVEADWHEADTEVAEAALVEAAKYA